jgi:adenosine/AMP kinase
MELKTIKIEKPEEMNFILGQSHFIKTVEDIHEAIITTNPALKFGLAFCEASGDALVRLSGNDEKLIKLAEINALNISAGHSFILFMEEGFPINILNTIKMVPEVVRIFCATANPTEVIIVENDLGNGILGVIDGMRPNGVENEEDLKKRKDFLRMIGYKL